MPAVTLRPLLPLLGLLGLSACQVSAWRPLPPSPESVAAQRPHEARITRTDGSTLTLYDVALAGDSLRGLTNPTNVRTATSVALREVRSLEMRRVNGTASATLSLLGLAGIFLIVGLATLSTQTML